MRWKSGTVALISIGLGTSYLAAQDAYSSRPTFNSDGSVNVPAFHLPPSKLISRKALQSLKLRAQRPDGSPRREGDIASNRAALEARMLPMVEAARQRYPIDVTPQSIGGVRVHVITPSGASFDRLRVLINLHGGGFTMCADACAILESAPVAVLGKYKVVTIDYRMAPEVRHPAALQDIERVYRSLLKTYPAKSIGLYGCSAGGALTAQAAVWMPSRGLPQFAAIGIFGAGAMPFQTGDSSHVAAYIDGTYPPPTWGARIGATYFEGADMSHAIISAAKHPDALAHFPPTLIITGNRAMDLSPAIYTNSQLLKAGVPSTLMVGEGMGHCYIYQADLPEARDAVEQIVRFFRANLQ